MRREIVLVMIKSRDVVRIIITYLSPYHLKNFFSNHNIDCRTSFVYDGFDHCLPKNCLNYIFGVFPNIVMKGIYIDGIAELRGLWCDKDKDKDKDKEKKNVKYLHVVEDVGFNPEFRMRKCYHSQMRAHLPYRIVCDYGMLRGYTGLTKLVINFNPKSTSVNDVDFLQQCSRLKKIELLSMTSLCNLDGISGCHDLVKLKLVDCDDVSISCLSSLRHLTIEDYSINGLTGLGECKLHKLVLRDVINFDNFVVNSSLRKIVLDKCDLCDIVWMKGLCNLESLIVRGCGNLSCIELGMESLRSVNIYSCVKLQSVSFRAAERISVTFCASLKQAPTSDNVRWMDLSNCTNLVELNNCEELETLILSGCKRLAKLGPLSNMHKLKNITLRECRMLQNVDALLYHKSLRTIKITNCNAISYGDVDRLRKKFGG